MQTRLVPVFAATLIAATAHAQTVEFVSVIKLQLHEQSSATQVDLLPAINLPFGIDLNVGGVDIGLLSPAPSVAGPISVPEPSHNGGVLGYSVDDEEWRYGWPSFNDWGTETLGELDSLFGSGVYTMTVAGVSVPLSLTGDVYPPAPVVTLTGGAWVGGVYEVSADAELTLSVTSPGYGTHLDDGIYIDVWGPGFESDEFQLASFEPSNTMTLVIPAGSLTPGEEYEGDAGFIAVTDLKIGFPGLPAESFAVAGYDQATAFTISVTSGPEPVVEFVEVIKIQFHNQTSATQVDLLPPGDLPYGMDIIVEGTDAVLLSPAPSVVGPISVPEPGHNGGVLGINLQSEEWGYGWPNFDNWGTQTLSELDSLFASGTYTITADGVAVPLTLTGDAYAATAPVVTLSGGAWQGGEYVIAADEELTLTTSGFVEFGTHLDDAVWIFMGGGSYDNEVFHFASESGDNFETLTVPAGTLLTGEVYLVEVGFVAIVDGGAIVGLPGAFALAGYEKSTALQLRVADVGCNPADLAEPFGVLNFFDVSAFLTAYAAQEPAADLTGDGVFDFFDVAEFLTHYNAGCP